MTEGIFTKLGITYERLTFDYLLPKKEWENMYVGYERQLIEKIPEMLDVLSQVQNITFGDFFQEEYLREGNFTKRYTDIKTVEFKSFSIGIHVDFRTVLFYYLIKELRAEIDQFLAFLQNDLFKQQYKNRYIEDEYFIKIDKLEEGDFFKICSNVIPNYKQLHLFFQTTHLFYYDDRTFVIRKEQLNKRLEHLDKAFDFKSFQFQ